MPSNPSSAFWERLPAGVEVAVASAAADELLGVRDGFLSCFRQGLPIAAVVPGTRRRGGLIGSLTAGVETRRSAVAVSTLHALSSLLYEVMAPPRHR